MNTNKKLKHSMTQLYTYLNYSNLNTRLGEDNTIDMDDTWG